MYRKLVFRFWIVFWKKRRSFEFKKIGIEREVVITIEQEFLKPTEVAKRFSISEAHLRKWAKAGIIPCYRLADRTTRYKVEEVEAWLDSRKMHPEEVEK